MTAMMEDRATTDWRSIGECRNWEQDDHDIDPFFGPDDDDYTYPPKEALAYCNPCPVKVECLEWAMQNDPIGVFGGTTEFQRRQLKRHMPRARCPGCSSQTLVQEGTTETCLSCGVSWPAV